MALSFSAIETTFPVIEKNPGGDPKEETLDEVIEREITPGRFSSIRSKELLWFVDKGDPILLGNRRR